MSEAESEHPNLHEVAKTIAADLKCEIKDAMGHAINGVAATARAAGLQISEKPDADEIEGILTAHWQTLEKFVKEVEKKTAPPKPEPSPKKTTAAVRKKKRNKFV